MDQTVTAKVQQYESFLNDNLKEDLKFLEIKLKEVNERLSNWYLLQKTATDLRDNHPRGFKTYVDLGCGIQCQAAVADSSVINVYIGLDIYLQMTLEEADQYCNMRIGLLNKEVKYIQSQANKVKAHIKIVLLGLQELQRL